MSLEMIREKTVTARKAQVCETCNRTAAQPGDKYHRATYVYDGRIYDWVQCKPCRDMGNEVLAWAFDTDAGVGRDDYAEWADEHADFGTSEQQATARAYLERVGVILDHPFLPVSGHPDDDECTNRADGTDETYCSRPENVHKDSLR